MRIRISPRWLARLGKRLGKAKWRTLLVLPASAALALFACSLLTNFDDSLLSETTIERCRDHVDNDGNGLVDCDDAGCGVFPECSELTTAACADGVDNDGDGLIDCLDPGCAALAGFCVEQTAKACSDGVDNDGDRLTDCNDPGCQALAMCQEKDAGQCSDGLDNDGDGLVDCQDFDCYGTSPCCKVPAPPLPGGDFRASPTCRISTCLANDPTCCVSGYERCNPFDPARWVPWGLPRAHQDGDAFLSNQPCGCDASGVVSVESVRLQSGLQVRFKVEIPTTEVKASICAGLTGSSVFPDTEKQCAGTQSPRMLLGLCFESTGSGTRRVVAIVDGLEEASAPVPESSTALDGRMSIDVGAVELALGPLQHRTTPLGPSLKRALLLVQGRGTQARLSQLVVQQGAPSTPRCQDPTAWYRHLARGEPVIPARNGFVPSEPSVIRLPDAKGFLMLFAGTTVGTGATALYRATSSDGLAWQVDSAPVIPESATDLRFGAAQSGPSLLYHGGAFHVWYTRDDEAGGISRRSIAHAQSGDGKTWMPADDPGGERLLPSAPPNWDSVSVSAPSVIEAPDRSLLIFYTGLGLEVAPRPAIGLARSVKGAAWVRLQSKPIIAPGDSRELACESPAVQWDAQRKLYLLWYTRRIVGEPPHIRHAVSLDAQLWSIFTAAPAISAGPLGTFDDRGLAHPAALLEQDRVRLWFTGIGATGLLQLGYAENRGSF